MAVSILIAIIGFGFLIIIHESGHFFIARAFGIEADEFAIGMGPKIISKTWGRTAFSLRAIPIGAFVMFADPELEEEDSSEAKTVLPNPFLSAAAWKRLLISLAGPLFNFGLAVLIFIFLAFFTGVASNESIIGGVMSGGAAESAGLQVGDRIVSIEGQAINRWQEITSVLAPTAGEEIVITIERAGKTMTFSLVPKLNTEGRGVIGITNSTEKYSAFASFKVGFQQTLNLIGETVVGFGSLFQKGALENLMGPIGIVSVTGEVAQTGFANFIFFLGYLSINLGVINLLPIPALDGGRTLFLLIEMIRGKKLNEKVESIVNTVGLTLVMGLILFISFRDIMKLW